MPNILQWIDYFQNRGQRSRMAELQEEKARLELRGLKGMDEPVYSEPSKYASDVEAPAGEAAGPYESPITWKKLALLQRAGYKHPLSERDVSGLGLQTTSETPEYKSVGGSIYEFLPGQRPTRVETPPKTYEPEYEYWVSPDGQYVPIQKGQPIPEDYVPAGLSLEEQLLRRERLGKEEEGGDTSSNSGILPTIYQYLVGRKPSPGAQARQESIERARTPGGATGTWGDTRVLDEATAAAILKEAGGDKIKAREIARKRGYEF